MPGVLDAHAGHRRAAVVANGNEQRMDAVMLVGDLKLREDHGHAAMFGCVADVFLVRLVDRRVDDELASGGVIHRRGFDAGDVRAVAALGHRKAAGQLEGSGLAQVAFVMKLGPERMHRAAEQAELHAEFDGHADIAVGQRFEGDGKGPHIAGAAVLGRVRQGADAFGGEDPEHVQHALAAFFLRPFGIAFEPRPLEDLQHSRRVSE